MDLLPQLSFFANLPRDLLVNLFGSYLQPEDLCRGPARVCKSWHCVCVSDDLWRAYCCLRWRDPMLPSGMTWKQHFTSIPRWWYRFSVKKDTENVWTEMYDMGKVVLCDPLLRFEAELVTREIMRRVRFNMEKIHNAFDELGYPSHYMNFPTAEEVEQMRSEFDEVEKLTGQPLPLSFRLYYEIVGGCDFIGDWRILEKWWITKGLTHKLAGELGYNLDPLYIPGYRPNELLSEVKYWLRSPDTRYYSYGLFGCSAAKAGTSASFFSMPLVPRSDAPIPGWVFTASISIKFVEYLSEAVSHGGFTAFILNNGPKKEKLPRCVQAIYDRVRRDLIPVGIRYLMKEPEVLKEVVERDRKGRRVVVQHLRYEDQQELDSGDEIYQEWAKRYKPATQGEERKEEVRWKRPQGRHARDGGGVILRRKLAPQE